LLGGGFLWLVSLASSVPALCLLLSPRLFPRLSLSWLVGASVLPRAARRALMRLPSLLCWGRGLAPSSVEGLLRAPRFFATGGQVVWGSVSPGSSRHAVVSGLFARSRALVSASCCLAAFLHGPSRGTLFTVRHAVSRGLPVLVFLCGGGASLPPDLASHCFVFIL